MQDFSHVMCNRNGALSDTGNCEGRVQLFKLKVVISTDYPDSGLE